MMRAEWRSLETASCDQQNVSGRWHGYQRWCLAWVSFLCEREREREREIKGILTAPHQAHGRQLWTSQGIWTCKLNTERNRWAVENQSALEHQFWHDCVIVVVIVKKKRLASGFASVICVGTTSNVPNDMVLSLSFLLFFKIVVCLSRTVQGVTSPV